MKSNILFAVLPICMALATLANGAPFQDLDRVNQIVDQARGLADAVRGQSIQSRKIGLPYNPFRSAVKGEEKASGIGIAPNRGIGVGIGQNDIQIEAAGQRFNIPRVSGNSTPRGFQTPDTVDPQMAGNTIPPRNQSGRILNSYGPYPGIGNGIGVGIGAGLEAEKAMEYARQAQMFSKASKEFANGNHEAALQTIQPALMKERNFVPYSEFFSLVYFANGDYKTAAYYAYPLSLTSSSLSWKKIRKYYNGSANYEKHYQQLQLAARTPNADASVHFLLGVHHMALGHREEAAKAFELVIATMPNDPYSKMFLEDCRSERPQPIR